VQTHAAELSIQSSQSATTGTVTSASVDWRFGVSPKATIEAVAHGATATHHSS
jgi:hypothetical protein